MRKTSPRSCEGWALQQREGESFFFWCVPLAWSGKKVLGKSLRFSFAWLDLICVICGISLHSLPLPSSPLSALPLCAALPPCELHLISKLSTRRCAGRWHWIVLPYIYYDISLSGCNPPAPPTPTPTPIRSHAVAATPLGQRLLCIAVFVLIKKITVRNWGSSTFTFPRPSLSLSLTLSLSLAWPVLVNVAPSWPLATVACGSALVPNEAI